MILSNTQTLQSGDAQILICSLEQSTQELIDAWLHLGFELNDEFYLKTEKRKREFLSTRLALSSMLNQMPVVMYTPEGKPYLANNSHQISISHTQGYIAVMLHPTLAVGIDIEQRSAKIMKVYSRFLGEKEQQHFCIDEKSLQIAWSAKEALYKVIGKEAVDFANQLYLFPFDTKNEGEITALHIPNNRFFKVTYKQNSHYTLAYCIAEQ